MTKAAVVGVGYLGRYHAQKYARSQGAELTAVVDVSAERAEQCAAELGVKALTDYHALPALGVQCASVVSSTSTHYEIAKYLLQNEIDVLVEKPITVRREEALELIEIAREKGRILQVGHLERFNPAFVAMKQLLTKPCFFEVRRIAQFTGRGADVDVVLDLMIHDIDIVSHLVGKPLERLEAIGVPVLTNSFDIANARLHFEGGAIANVTASRAAFVSERTIRIFQPELYISLDYGKKKLKVYKKKEGESSADFPQIEISEFDIEERDALNDEINDFLGCVAERRQPVVTGEDGLRALDLAFRIKEAIKSGIKQMISEMDLPVQLRLD